MANRVCCERLLESMRANINCEETQIRKNIRHHWLCEAFKGLIRSYRAL